MREIDHVYFLWNGEHPIKISPGTNEKWHHNYGELPEKEMISLNSAMNSRAYTFAINGHGRYRVIKRGNFME